MKRFALGCVVVTAVAVACGDDDVVPSAPGAPSVPDAGPEAPPAPEPDAAPPPFPCTPGEGTWALCPESPLYLAGNRMPDGNLEISVGDPDVMFDEEERIWKAWWSTGAARSFAEADRAPIYIKYAESRDGITWNVQPEPVLKSGEDPTNWDNSKVETPSVVKVPSNPPERRYVMFYSGGNDVDYPPTFGFTWYQLGMAFSPDGKKFTRLPASESPYAGKPSGFRKVEGLLLHGRDAFPGVANVEEGGAADPEIVVENGQWHLFFSSFATRADRRTFVAYGMSQARASDGVRFTPADGNPRVVGGTQPSIIKVGDTYELYLAHDDDGDNARVPTSFNPYLGIWKRTSTDLVTWSARGATHDFTWTGARRSERYGMVKAGDVAYRDGIRRYYYVAFGDENVPPGFGTILRPDAGIPLPDAAVRFDAGIVVPAVLGLHVAARIR